MIDEAIRQKIRRVREALAENPDGILVGQLQAGSPRGNVPDGVPEEYVEFLCECDGARCGSVDLWSSSCILSQQYRSATLPGGASSWFNIGQLLYEPIFIKVDEGTVWHFLQGPPPDTEGTPLGSFSGFLSETLFGENYVRLFVGAGDDDWFTLLRSLGLVD